MALTKTLLLCAAAGIVCGLGGYRHGTLTSDAAWQARLADARAARLAEDNQRALALIRTLNDTNRRFLTASAKAAALETDLLDANAAIEAERGAISKRIAHATESSAAVCAGLSSDWVREYNQATGNPSPAASDPGTGAQRTGGAGQAAGASGTALPGLSPESSLTSPEDVLAHIRDYGAYCKGLEQQAAGWKAFDAIRRAGR